MGDPRGFLKVRRQEAGYRPVEERVLDYGEVEKQLPEEERKLQASRCMDCGVPFCQWGCPVSNIMPEWQDMMFRGKWKDAYHSLQRTNNFPEFTGRVCPAPCEPSCVLSINDDPVTIRQNELAVIERAFEEGWVRPQPPALRTGKKVAIIGSGPAGLACADILNLRGHSVTLFESEDAVGGYLRFGIPDFKLEKKIIDRRVDIMVQEGLEIQTGVTVGRDLSVSDLLGGYDAICVTTGARRARDLAVEGRDLNGIIHAMVYLEQQNRSVRGDHIPENCLINAYNKHVVVIGGGDTGSDCVGSANRQGARKITQLELLPMPPRERSENDPWPLWPKILKTSSSHEEGCERLWSVSTKKFLGDGGRVEKLIGAKVEWTRDESGNFNMNEVPGSDFEIQADLVLLAMGFVHVEHEGLVKGLGVNLNKAGNIAVDNGYMTSIDGVFAAGDSIRGASLVVWAIHQGREAAEAMHVYLSSQ